MSMKKQLYPVMTTQEFSIQQPPRTVQGASLNPILIERSSIGDELATNSRDTASVDSKGPTIQTDSTFGQTMDAQEVFTLPSMHAETLSEEQNAKIKNV